MHLLMRLLSFANEERQRPKPRAGIAYVLQK